ncbi:MAG: NAD(P)/FAD-dependent oxidoreductase [Lautropia sp.]
MPNLTAPASACTPPHVAIVGGGVLGSVLALRLRQYGFTVTLLEAEPALGGLAAQARIADFAWDRFYHVLLSSDRHTRALIDELGLTGRVRWGTTRTGFFIDGRLHSLSNAVEFLRFPPLSLLDKLRLGATIALGSRIRDPRRLEYMLATDWLRRWSGRRVLERVWSPLLQSKLGDNDRIASAAFIWAIIARMYAARRSGLKRELFGYLDGGYGPLFDALRARLVEAGVTFKSSSAVERIVRDGPAARGGFTLALRDGTTLAADQVVSTLAPALFGRQAPQLQAAERARLDRVAYQGVLCATLLLKRPLSDFYVTNITDRWVPFTGVIEMTALVDRAAFAGHSLVYLPLYLAQDDPRWHDSDEAIQTRFLEALARMYPGFDRADVVDFRIARARHVLAISTLGYSTELMPPVATSVPGLFHLTSAQIAYGTLNVNETLGLVADGLPRLLALLEQSLQAAGAAAPARASDRGWLLPDGLSA